MSRSIVQSGAALGVLLGLLPASRAALPTGPGATAASQPAQATIHEGFWPTEKLIDAVLRRWAGAAAEAYGLNPKQRTQLEAQLLERWPKFLRENRAELQPLLNEYLRARIATEPPSADAVRGWTRDALPQLERLRRFIAEGNDQFAALLTTGQRTRFEADRAELAMKLEALHTRLQAWERGEYDTQEWRDLTRPVQASRPTSEDTPHPKFDPADEFELEMAAWDRVVRRFIADHELDDAQRTTAESILAELKSRARDHYHSRRVRIAVLEELIRFPKLETTDAEIEAELIQLYGPIDEMFRELQRRLRLIPTEAQTRQARMKSEE